MERETPPPRVKIMVDGCGKVYPLADCSPFAVVQDISLTVDEGDFVVILGESGCGKSTLLGMIAGLEKPSQGTIRVRRNGGFEAVTGPHPSRSFLFQQPSLLPWLTVEENIAFGCRLRGDRDNLDYRLNQFIEMMGLSTHAASFPAELSVGQAQRVCLARALIGRPEILLLDEPFGALDTLNRHRLQEELVNIWQSERFTAVFVTHDIEEAVLLGNKVVLLGDTPSRVIEIFDVGLLYPRQATDEEFFHVKTRIVRKFKELKTRAERRLCIPELDEAGGPR